MHIYNITESHPGGASTSGFNCIVTSASLENASPAVKKNFTNLKMKKNET